MLSRKSNKDIRKPWAFATQQTLKYSLFLFTMMTDNLLFTIGEKILPYSPQYWAEIKWKG